MPITNIGQWLRFFRSREDRITNAVGGVIVRYVAHTTTLLVGDAVYLHGVGVVNKSTNSSLYAGYVGQVVGGDSTNNEPSDALGATAATSGQGVLVQITGIARGIVGATGFTAGTNVLAMPSGATAGRVIPATGTGTIQILGTVVSTQATAGSEVLFLINHRSLGAGAGMITNTELANMTQGTVKVGGASDAPTDLDASGDGKILIGDGTDINSVAVSGDIAIDNAGVTTIQNDAVTAAKAPVFVSTEQTGTGSAQDIAHGLGAVPTLVLIAVTEDPAGSGFDVAEGTHDGTDVKATVTSGVKYKVFAWA